MILVIPAALILLILTAITVRLMAPQEDFKSRYFFKDFESAIKCRSCQPGFCEQWSQAMMSQAYTHTWGENELDYRPAALHAGYVASYF